MKQKNEVVEVQNPNAANNKDFLSVTEAFQLIGVSREMNHSKNDSTRTFKSYSFWMETYCSQMADRKPF
jgi:hypothetical protein